MAGVTTSCVLVSVPRDLIAHESRFTQVLSLPPTGRRRSSEPGQGLMAREILRRAAALPVTYLQVTIMTSVVVYVRVSF
jgi:hypothetical protein